MVKLTDLNQWIRFTVETCHCRVTPTGLTSCSGPSVTVWLCRTHPCSRCCAWARSRGSTDSCRSPRCSYRCRFHTAAGRTRQYLPDTMTSRDETHLRPLHAWERRGRSLTHTHGLVRRGLEAVVAQTAEAALSVDTFTVTADVRDLLTLVTVWPMGRRVTSDAFVFWIRFHFHVNFSSITTTLSSFSTLLNMGILL